MIRSLQLTALAFALIAASVAQAQSRLDRTALLEPVWRVTKNAPNAKPANRAVEHPLMPAIRLAQQGLDHINADIKDYTCTLVKRENVNGKIMPYEYIFTKVRHEQRDANGRIVEPFGVYMYFLGPENVKGREVIWVKGENDGKLIAHEGGAIMGLVTAKLDPEGALAMRGNRYPISEVGIKTLVERLVEVATLDLKYGECEVQFFEGAKINGRVCTCIQVTHPVPRREFRFHLARIFIDKELMVPVRYEAYNWPSNPGGKPELIEEYTYLNMKTNVGLTDADFSKDNPKYNFR